MSMDSFQLQLLALLMLLHTATCADGTREVIGAVGASVTFHIPPPAGNAVFWNFGNDPIATVLPKDPPEVVFSEEKYKKRFTFLENGRALSISQLSLEDAGIYSVKIDGKISTFTLRVYGKLAEPTVTCEDRNCSAGSCRFSLRCSVPGTGLGSISYLWSKGEQPWDEGPTVLVVNESSWNEPESLTCTARNPVSSRNVTVVAPGDLCIENATHPPGPGELPPPVHVQPRSRASPGVPVCPGQLFHVWPGRRIGEPEPSTLQLLPKPFPGNVGALRAVPSAPPGWLCPLGDFGRAGVPPRVWDGSTESIRVHGIPLIRRNIPPIPNLPKRSGCSCPGRTGRSPEVPSNPAILGFWDLGILGSWDSGILGFWDSPAAASAKPLVLVQDLLE
ncbi:SLAM family member 9-like isoform X1 [Corvus hawaiiensis]|uniref:SLAM family member 9-like isoform X1 n=1 Tax=Corvus hawaiiensis TaxID=134902 RepID=UPI002019A0F7|nr:SLAM family member 9-like isoform X1 [Corvus hawaiiensis]